MFDSPDYDLMKGFTTIGYYITTAREINPLNEYYFSVIVYVYIFVEIREYALEYSPAKKNLGLYKLKSYKDTTKVNSFHNIQ